MHNSIVPILVLVLLLGLGYGVMLLRLWRRTGMPRAFNTLPQSKRGVVRVFILASLFGLLLYLCISKS